MMRAVGIGIPDESDDDYDDYDMMMIMGCPKPEMHDL